MSMIPKRIGDQASISAFGQERLSPLTQPEPTMGAVIDAMVNETYYGVGSYSADMLAFDVEEAKVSGTPIDENQFKLIAGNSGIKYEDGMTAEAAKLLADNQIDRNLNSSVIANADGVNKAAGYAAAFSTGIFEPKNVAYGAAGALLTGPLAAALPVGRSLSRISQLRRIASMNGQRLARTAEEYKALATVGAMDGFVGAALAEPSNRDTANTLQQDYTMADTLWNVGLSLAFGTGARTLPPFIADKWGKYKAKTPDVIALEVDTAVEQLATSRVVDVAHVEKIVDGEISAKPIADRANIIRNSEIPEAAEFDINKVSYKIEPASAKDFSIGTDKPGRFIYKITSDNGQRENGFLDIEKIENGNARIGDVVIRGFDEPNGRLPISSMRDLLNQVLDKHPEVTQFSGERVSGARMGGRHVFGGGGIEIAQTLNSLIKRRNDIINDATARLDRENKAAIAKSISDDVSPLNDTAIDFEAAKALEVAEAELEARGQTTYEDALKTYTEELNSMIEQGLVTDAEAEALQDALSQIDDAKMEDVMKATYYCLTGA